VVVTAALALIGLVAGTGLALPVGAAGAATPGVTTSLVLNGSQTYNGVPVVESGDTETLQVQYDNTVAPGSTVKVKLGDNVTIGTLPPGNTAVTSIVKDPDDPSTVDLTFADPFPSDVNQGVLSLNFTINPVAASTPDQLTWSTDGDTQSKNVIILAPGDSPQNVTDAQSKAESGNYNGLVSVDADGTVHIAESAVGKALTYTLTASTTTANPSYPISDQLPAGLAYVSGSFAATLTTWDANGLNETTNPTTFTPTVTGNGFTGTADLPADSVLKVTYQAQIPDDAARDALEAQLQAQHDALGPDGGNFSINLTNTATIDGNPKTATVTLTGSVAGPSKPNVGQAFGKTSDWSTQNITPNTDGSLTPPIDITYTLTANLTQWDGSDTYRTLDGNVVISDPLPSQASWNTAAAGFLTATGITLTQAASCPSATAFAADTFLDQYCVNGQTLLVNVGQDNTTVASIQVKAQLRSVTGLPAGTTTVQGGKAYVLGNSATFAYTSTDGPHTSTATRTVTVVNRGDGSNGYNDPAVFTKTTTPSQVSVNPGQSTTVTYVFTVNANQGVDAADVHLVDPVDPNVFDASDPAAIAAALTGSYGSTSLTAADFTLTTNADGALVIALSAAGKTAVGTGDGSTWTVNLPLPTKPVVGKQTIAITNKATLYGPDGTPLYWSQVASSVSSYGDEAEVRKTVYDDTSDSWTTNLRAQLDANGNLINDTYVYQVQFIPHGGYNNVTIVPVNDLIPAGEQFLGFVTADNVATGADPTAGPVDVGGNLQATYNTGDGTMSLVQKPGTLLDASQSITAYFAVKIVHFTPDVPIVNTIGTSSATITPTNGYPLTIAKQDSADQSTDINDPNARFQLTDADGNVMVDNIFVSDGYLRVAGADGQPAAVKVSQPGTYTLSEITPPAGYVESNGTLQIVVGADSLPDQQTFYDAPVGPSVSVGDFVWVDSNHDGRQDSGEPGIPGVVLTITGPDGQPVTGVNGLPVGPQTIDADGKYSFDGLPVLTAGQHYTVTIDQEASTTALAPYTPTKSGVGDRAGDSSTWTAQSEGLTAGGQRDPTLDFGFVTKTYAIGDKVWIDSNHNGVQDGSEPPLPGVKVSLLDGDGKTVATTTTDANGRYIFDNLPAGTYQVKFQLTPDQAAKYSFTSLNKGAAGTDSDANPNTGLTKTFTLGDTDTNLTTSYTNQTVQASQGIDPTWDAGVIPLDTGGSGTGGTGSSSGDGGGSSLASTGEDVLGIGVAGLIALLVGAGILLLSGLRRRRRTG
jgi:DNA-directed RNA polymerase II subunit RPB1